MFQRNATKSNVASSASDVQLLAENPRRQFCVIFNDSTQVLYVSFGSTAASATSYSYKLGAGDTLEVNRLEFNGEIRGIWASANGNARITEVV